MGVTISTASGSASEHRWPRVWVLDEDRGLCAKLERLIRALALEVATFEDAEPLLARWNSERPNCLVLGLGPRQGLGLQLLEEAKVTGEHVAVVLVSRSADVATTVRAMKQGAVDVLERPVDLGALLAAVVRGLARDAEWREARNKVAAATQRLDALTPREREVFGLVASGKPNKRIAAELGTSEKTIKVHRGRVMHKLGASSVVDLIRLIEQVEAVPA